MEYKEPRQNQSCNHSDKACVSLVPIFNHLDTEQMNEVMETVESKAYDKGELVYQAGEPSNVLTIVNRGSLRIYRLSETGKEQLVRVLKPGDFTGELALFNETEHEHFAEAMQPTSICQIKREDLQSLLVKYPTISLKILQELSSRLDQSEQQVTRFTTESTEQRLALYLADLSVQADDHHIVKLPLAKKDLASYIGTTPETVSRKLLDLEEKQLIKRLSGSRIQLLDEDGLLFLD